MNSTEEVSKATRVAHQYNMHIYKYLIYALVNSSSLISKFRVELDIWLNYHMFLRKLAKLSAEKAKEEKMAVIQKHHVQEAAKEYTSSTMKFYDRFYQIRDSMLPPDRIREEQINIFRELVKKNDYLRQEVHKVQRVHWNLRERGHRVSMAQTHVILQGFPELCVSYSPDKVPLDVLCDQISHKYNLRNERFIKDLLSWADEQSQARKMARQAEEQLQARKITRRPSSRSTKYLSERVFFPDVNSILAAIEKDPKISEQEKSDQPKSESSPSDHEVEDQPTPSTDVMNEVTPVPSWCDFDQDQPVILSFQDMLGESFHEMSTVVQPTKQAEEMGGVNGLDELMPALQDIPELEPATIPTPQASVCSVEISRPQPTTSVQEQVKKNHPKPEEDLSINMSNTEEAVDIIPDSEDENTEIQKVLSRSAHLTSLTESMEEIRAKIYFQLKSSNTTSSTQAQTILGEMKQSDQQASMITGEDSLVCNTQSPATDILPEPEITTSTVKMMGSLKPEILREAVPQIQTSTKQDQSMNSVSTQRPKIAPRPLVGSDKPHVYENKIKRRQHGTSKVTENMTPGELQQYEKKRDEVLQAMEVKKQRTMMLLNKQYNKDSQPSSSLHYYKVQNTPKVESFNKPAAVPTRPNQSCKPRPDILATVSNSISVTSRKRPATSVNTGSTAPKRARSSRPRIILRIFRDEEIDDWNVEQVIDRY